MDINCFWEEKYYSEEKHASLPVKENFSTMGFACTILWNENMGANKTDSTTIINNTAK